MARTFARTGLPCERTSAVRCCGFALCELNLVSNKTHEFRWISPNGTPQKHSEGYERGWGKFALGVRK